LLSLVGALTYRPRGNNDYPCLARVRRRSLAGRPPSSVFLPSDQTQNFCRFLCLVAVDIPWTPFVSRPLPNASASCRRLSLFPFFSSRADRSLLLPSYPDQRAAHTFSRNRGSVFFKRQSSTPPPTYFLVVITAFSFPSEERRLFPTPIEIFQ